MMGKVTYFISGPSASWGEEGPSDALIPWEVGLSAGFNLSLFDSIGEEIQKVWPITIHYFQKIADVSAFMLAWDEQADVSDGRNKFANFPGNNSCILGGSTRGVPYEVHQFLTEKETEQIVVELSFESPLDKYPYTNFSENSLREYESQVNKIKSKFARCRVDYLKTSAVFRPITSL